MTNLPPVYDVASASPAAPSGVTEFEAQHADYDSQLSEHEASMQDAFDRNVILLSGGAFAVSMTFVKEMLGADQAFDTLFLKLAWICWITAVTAMLVSYFVSAKGMRAASWLAKRKLTFYKLPAKSSDYSAKDREAKPRIKMKERAKWAIPTLNWVGLLGTIGGMVMMGLFVHYTFKR
jgi:hypothetical protein